MRTTTPMSHGACDVERSLPVQRGAPCTVRFPGGQEVMYKYVRLEVKKGAQKVCTTWNVEIQTY